MTFYLKRTELNTPRDKDHRYTRGEGWVVVKAKQQVNILQEIADFVKSQWHPKSDEQGERLLIASTT